MSFLRKLVFAFVSKQTAQKMEAESRRWMLVCPNCHMEVSIWDVGGLRYKASGNPKRRMVCHGCGQVGWHSVVYRAEVGS